MAVRTSVGPGTPAQRETASTAAGVNTVVATTATDTLAAILASEGK